MSDPSDITHAAAPRAGAPLAGEAHEAHGRQRAGAVPGAAPLGADRLRRAGMFLWASGRVLDQRRFGHLFGTAPDPDGVLAALDAYRAPGGGYAFGLEPDVRGPAPQPIAATAAVRVLAEAGALHGPAARALCDWLAAQAAPDGGVPPVLPSLRPYPRAPWMEAVAGTPAGDLLTTGQIAGPLLRAGVTHPWLDAASSFCREAIERLEATHPYEARAAVMFLDGAPDRSWARRQAERLGGIVRDARLVLLDPEHPEDAVLSPGYAPGEHHLPHDYAPAPDSLARAWFTADEMARGLRALASAQQEDGGWPITWRAWAPVTVVEGRPGVTITALVTLRAYGGTADE